MSARHHHLTEQQKEFIASNYKTMSAKQMAKKLGVPRHTVQWYHKQMILKTAPADTTGEKGVLAGRLKARGTKISILVFLSILVLSLNLRKATFDLPHYRGDQHHYVGLAFKLDTRGMNGYNLRGIDLLANRKYPNLVQIAPTKDKGHVLEGLERAKITYYDQPLHHIPFGFPLAIMISHRIFAPGSPYFMLVANDTEIIRKAGPKVGLRNFKFPAAIRDKQFYSIIIPLFFSLLMISLVFFLARRLFKSDAIALTAMFLMAISPIDLLTSQKIWADDMTAALALLSVFLYVVSVERKNLAYAFAAGLSCGAATVTKQNGAFIAFAIILWHFLSNMEGLSKKKTFLKTVFDPGLLLFGLGALLSAGYWFFKVTATYGNPAYRPHQADIGKVALTDWFKIVGNRPRYMYLLGIPYQNPLFALAYLSPLWLLYDRKNRKGLLLVILWAAVFFFIFEVYLGRGGKEHRYMLPAYPALAVLGAYAAERFRVLLDRHLGMRIGTILLIAALLFSALWGIPMAFDTIYVNGALIMKPF